MKLINKAEQAAADILRAFENPNTLPTPLAQVFVNRRDGAPCRSWSWRNQLIVALNGHREARGYRQWEAVGRKVKPGAKAFRILSPLAKTVVDEKTQEERVAVFGFRGTPVFGPEQTEGDPLPRNAGNTEAWLSQLPLVGVARSWGLTIQEFNGGGANVLGSYRAGTGIALGVRNLSTWCHELVHAADDRLGTLTAKKVKRETVAELGGAILLSILGHQVEADLGGCWEYVKRFAGDEKTDILAACGKVLDRTCNAVALILETAEAIETISQPDAMSGIQNRAAEATGRHNRHDLHGQVRLASSF